MVNWSTKPSTKQHGTINQPTPNQLPTTPQRSLLLALGFPLFLSMRQVLVPAFPWVGLLGLAGLGWSFDWLVGRLVAWLVGQMVNQTINQATRDNELTNPQPTPNQPPTKLAASSWFSWFFPRVKYLFLCSRGSVC